MRKDPTHDPTLTSWVESANEPQSDFPIQNLPFGVFAMAAGEPGRVGVAIGDQVLDVAACSRAGLIGDSAAARASTGMSLNELMALEPAAHSALRAELSELLRADSGPGAAARAAAVRILVPMREVEMRLPAEVGDYTDFYASVHHARNVGSMFRPDNPLLPNYRHVPIGYHGRASTIIPSGAPVRRPQGQTKPADSDDPAFGPSSMLDYESELGFFVGQGNPAGTQIPIAEAKHHIFGYCLVNDWSARDMQAWEYQPLGPFLAKNFATTISPWIITADAAAPFAVPAAQRAEGDPEPLPYLSAEADREAGGLAATLEVHIATARMRAEGFPPVRLSRAPFAGMYWTPAQMLAHHASNGCVMRPGDLLASGTVSGDSQDARGCLLELTWRGANPIALPTGEIRRFLEDGDEVIMTGYLEAEGYRRIGLGECRGTILSTVE